MKFSCYKNDLREALQLSVRVVAEKPMTPILAGIYLHADGSTLELQSTNLVTGIVTRIPVNTEEAGTVVVSGKRFQEFVRNMPDDTITFTTVGNMLQIESGGASVELLTMTASDYPTIQKPETDKTFRIRTTALRELIKRTAFAASKEDTRPVFLGCCMEVNGDRIALVASNGNRLSLMKEKLVDNGGECRVVIPASTLRGLMLRIDPQDVTDNYVTVNYSLNNVTFAFDNVYIATRVIDGEFPRNYTKVIPKTGTTQIEVNTAEFKKAIEFVSLMSRETEYNTVTFKIDDKGLEMTSNSPSIGGAAQGVSATVKGEDLTINFNVNFILDVLRVINSKKLNIMFNGSLSPAAFTEPDNDKYVYICTPVRGRNVD